MKLVQQLGVVVVCGCIGFLLGMTGQLTVITDQPIIAMVFGVGIGGTIVGILAVCQKLTARYLLTWLCAFVLSAVFLKVLLWLLPLVPISEGTGASIAVFSFVAAVYAFFVVLIKAQDEYQFVLPFVTLKGSDSANKDIVLDTSVIIDGRIADMCTTSFLSGRLIIPRFVLKELQMIADSSDKLKRNRGRRGLEILNRIKEQSRLTVKINDADFPNIASVDAKLVKLAQTIGARVFTNDYNLAKVAELQNVEILNIHELSHALKPVVLPGEEMEVKVIKEGKEHSQGIGYLEDGTMIVIEKGRKLMGRTVRVVVTSAYQTQAGRMIFAKYERGR